MVVRKCGGYSDQELDRNSTAERPYASILASEESQAQLHRALFAALIKIPCVCISVNQPAPISDSSPNASEFELGWVHNYMHKFFSCLRDPEYLIFLSASCLRGDVKDKLK